MTFVFDIGDLYNHHGYIFGGSSIKNMGMYWTNDSWLMDQMPAGIVFDPRK